MNRQDAKKANHRNSSNLQSAWLPAIIGVGFMAASLFVWQALIAQEHSHIKRVLELRAKDLKTNTERLLEFQTQALLRMVKRWEKRGGTPKEEWESDARLYVSHHSLYQAIEWADSSFHVRWIVPLEGNEKAQDLYLAFEERRRIALEKARDSREITITPAIDLVQGEKGFLVNLPIYLGKDFDGFILGVFRINKLFSSILTDKVLSRYSIAIFDDEEEVYSHGSHNRENMDEWSIEKEIKFYNMTWRILVWPSQELFAELQSIVPEVALITGLLMSLLIALTVYFFQRASFRAKEVEVMNQDLLHEIIERRHAEDMLQKARDEWIQTFDAISDHVCILDMSGIIVKANKTMRDRFEPIHGNLTGLDYRLIYCGTATPDPQPPCASVLSGGPAVVCETRLPTMEGWQLVASYPITNSDGKQWGAVSVVRDITDNMRAKEALQKVHDEMEVRVKERTAELVRINEILEHEITDRKQAEEALRESEERFRQLAENIRQVFWMASPQMNQVLYVSPAYEEIWGRTCKSLYDSSRTWFESIHPDDRNKVVMAFQTKRIQKMLGLKYRIMRPDGSIRWINDQVFPVRDKSGEVYRVVGIAEDITEIKQAEEEQSRLREQLERVSKLESIGKLAGGIAHDFNNILTVISGYGQLLNKELKKDDSLKAYVQKIITSAERAAQLTQGLLAFGRKQISDQKPVEINELIKSSESLMRRLLGEDIELKTILVDRKCVVMADRGQMDQVLMNLATNARDAMPHGGDIIMHTKIVELDNEYIKTHGYGEVGKYVLLSFSDTGEGMDEETRKRIFEPYFTTKEVGRGTGLGLSIVYGIVKQHNGYINAYSEPGKGTSFKIYLPLIGSKVEEKGLETHTLTTGGTETILLAEDELEVRNLVKTVLERNGYKVIEAADGEDAIQKFMEHKDEINLLVFDVVMPKKSGKDAYDIIKKVNPEVRTLFMSGYSEDIIHKRGVMIERGLTYTTKPILPTELLKIIRELLDKPFERDT